VVSVIIRETSVCVWGEGGGGNVPCIPPPSGSSPQGVIPAVIGLIKMAAQGIALN